VSPGRNPGLITESPWISRVSRIVICLPSAPAFRSCVRTYSITCSIC